MRWLNAFTDLVGRKPLVIYRFSQEEWGALDYANRIRQFTVARGHPLTEKVRAPSVGLLIGKVPIRETEVYIGLVKSCAAATTLQSRIKFAAVQKVHPPTEEDILNLVTESALKAILRSRLESQEPVIPLSPKLSVHLVTKLAGIDANQKAMRAVIEQLDSPRTYSGNSALQQDAIDLALKTFGLPVSAPALAVTSTNDRETALNRVEISDNPRIKHYRDEAAAIIYEDSVIEHDARQIPGFTLMESDITGRAVFQNGGDFLEIITANRRPLERVFGVDLIYLNAVKRNVVMVQYKMLESDSNGHKTDWIYRPDDQLTAELTRMKRFSQMHSPGPLEYRINPQVFYLRFVRRDATLGKSPVTIPVDHFNILRDDPDCIGPKGSFRITYESLDGKYLRQEGFLGLLRSGYIGAYARTSADLECLIRAVLKGGRAVVRAVHARSSSAFT